MKENGDSLMWRRLRSVLRIGRLRSTLSYLRRNKAAGLSTLVLLILFICAIFADYIAPYNYTRQDLPARLQPPSLQHLLGTDQLGRDILSRILQGSRLVIVVMLISLAISASIGVTLGLISGFMGGFADQIIMRAMDILLAFPGIILALALITIMQGGFLNAVIAFSIRLIGPNARLVRGQVLAAREQTWVESARVIGASEARILTRHILPNMLGPITVQITFNLAATILGVASLSFMGLGAPPGSPDWGTMVNDGLPYIRSEPFATFFPGLAIFIVVFALNIIGDSLRDLTEEAGKASILF